jgi:hypothetical protein
LQERFCDAEKLLNAHRFDGAVYMCGYSIEIAMKHTISEVKDFNFFSLEIKHGFLITSKRSQAAKL